jgi:phage terminase large subunit-like protein
MKRPRRKRNTLLTPGEIGSKDLNLISAIPGYDPCVTAKGHLFDVEKAHRAVEFFPEMLTHVKGDKAKTPFGLEPWEAAIVANVFGWVEPDGRRRYREAFVFVPRKNGKTTLIAGFCLFVLVADGEPGAEIYSAAADREQATLVFDQAKGMVHQNPLLAERLKIYGGLGQRAIMYESQMSSYKVISADADTKHGYNTHLAVIDELHAQPNRELVDVLGTSTGSRRQPLILYITTSDYERPSICNEKYDYATKIRDGIIDDASFLPVVYEATKDDDWKDPKIWRKANPNFGISVSEEYLARECKRAQEVPSYENTFKRLHLNIRTEQAERWIQMEHWDLCGGHFDKKALIGRPCFGGLDLASTIDLASLVLYFPNDDHKLLCWFYCPADRILERSRRDKVPYELWRDEGLITATPGNVIDYEFIKTDLLKICETYDVQEIGFDPYNARQLCVGLADQHGLPMIEFRQGYLSMNDPCKKFETMVISHTLDHGGHKILRWMASNAVITRDPADNIKINKAKATEKIDGIIAAVMGLGCSMAKTIKKESVYEKRGGIFL